MAKQNDSILELGSWFILRCASADTLKVHDGLRQARFDVWTPIEHRRGKMPRTRKAYDKRFALMPSYSFARVDHLDDLLALSSLPNKDLPRFSVFTFRGGVPLIADDQLKGLREEELRTRRVFDKAKRRDAKGIRFDPGETVKLTEGPMAGMSGDVVGTQGQYTLVDLSLFGKAVQVKIASLLLVQDVPAANAEKRALRYRNAA